LIGVSVSGDIELDPAILLVTESYGALRGAMRRNEELCKSKIIFKKSNRLVGG
jgi:hypothetical protein